MVEFDEKTMGFNPDCLSVFDGLNHPEFPSNEDGATVFRSDNNNFHFSTGLEAELRVFTGWKREPETNRKYYDRSVETDIHINLGQAEETEIDIEASNEESCDGFSSGYNGALPSVGSYKPCTDLHIHAKGIYELDLLINIFGRAYEMLKKQRNNEYGE